MGEEKVPHIGDEVEEVEDAPTSETIKVCVYVDANDYYELKSYVARERISVSEWARIQIRKFLSRVLKDY